MDILISKSFYFRVLIVFIINIQLIKSMIYDKEFSFSGNYYMVQQFGFEVDGTVEINVKSLSLIGLLDENTSGGYSNLDTSSLKINKNRINNNDGNNKIKSNSYINSSNNNNNNNNNSNDSNSGDITNEINLSSGDNSTTIGDILSSSSSSLSTTHSSITTTTTTSKYSKLSSSSSSSSSFSSPTNSPDLNYYLKNKVSENNITNSNISNMVSGFNVTLWICQDRDYQSLIGSSPSNTIESKLCLGNLNSANCPISNFTLAQGTTQKFNIEVSDMYRIIILKCGDTRTANVHLGYTLKNPNGHLEKGYLQLPLLYRYIVIIMSILFVVVVIHWYLHRNLLNVIHYILIIILLLKLVLIVLALSYWTTANNSGRFQVTVRYLQNIFSALSETAFFSVLFVLSRGLKVTRQALTRSEFRTICIILLFLCTVLLFFIFFNVIYFYLALMILYFFMMPKIFTNITTNLRVLYSHSILSRYINNPDSVNNISLKKRVFTNLRSAVVLYLGAILFVNSLRIVMVWYLYWLAYSLSEPMFIIMMVFLCYSFRPSNSDLNIFRNSNLDTIDFAEITRNMETLLNQNADPILLSNMLEIQSFDPTSCFIIKYPKQSSSFKIAVQETPSNHNTNNNNNNKKDN